MALATQGMDTCRETLMAFLDYLVDPLLPSRSTLREAISLSQQELVAKQVHVVVLLYNYYHRKQNPGLEFLEFKPFCKLAVDLKPNIQLYFGVKQKTDDSELEEQNKDLSLTEKAIMSACETSRSLYVLNDDSMIYDWPITKVAVFLVDSQKENCVLFHSSITQGVWSVIEKEVTDVNQGLEPVNKKQRVMERMDATGLPKLAYLAVKETFGINQADLKILDCQSVYSTSEPKTTVRLYIMQCTQANHDMNVVPINDVMESLQGSLVDNQCVTPVVEYFHLLPFAEKLSDWLKSGKETSQDFLHFELTNEDENCNNSLQKDEPFPSISEKISTTFHDSKKTNTNISEFIEATKEVTNGKSCNVNHPESEKVGQVRGTYRRKEHTTVYKKRTRSQKNNSTCKNSCIETSDKGVEECRGNGTSNSMDINGKGSIFSSEDIVRGQNLTLSGQKSDQVVRNGGNMVVADFPDACSKDRDVGTDFERLQKMHLTFVSKDPLLSQIALEILSRKADLVSQKIRNFADELASYERKKQTILRGGEDHLAVKLEALLDGWSERLLQTNTGAEDLSPVVKRKKVSKSNLSLPSPSEQLDGICREKNWMIPSYNISTLEGGFQATVKVKGDRFECSSEGTECTTPFEARNSAASNILANMLSLDSNL